MKRFILVIDQGTTSSRVVLYSKNFKIFDKFQKEFKQYFPNEGWVEHDALEIWNDVKNLIKKILKKNKLFFFSLININLTGKLIFLISSFNRRYLLKAPLLPL